MNNELILEVKNITKNFPGTKALDKAKFQLYRGEIHALMGENGAGKSTFIKILTGVLQPDEGDILLDGTKVYFSNSRDARKQGIVAIYQHATSYPQLTVSENIFIGHEIIYRSGFLNWGEMHRQTNILLAELGVNFDARTIMSDLSVAQRQIVEIAKALSANARIIIMDEPTAALSQKESEELYKIAESLRDQNFVSIIFISHRFEDIYRLATQVTVFRDSKYIGSWPLHVITEEKLVTAMVGRKISEQYPKTVARIGAELLRVEKLSRLGSFSDVSFAVRSGEVVGLTGLVGSGRTEICECICGIHKPDTGNIFYNGDKVNLSSPIDAIKLGIGFLPEDRQKEGLILDWSTMYNITISIITNISNKIKFINSKKEKEFADYLFNKVNIKANSVLTKVNELSGGNQQKVVVAKLLSLDNLNLVVLDEPTKGVDVGAKAIILKIVNNLAREGYGVLLVSSEMPEILGMCDTVCVMREGKLVCSMKIENASQEAILSAAMV